MVKFNLVSNEEKYWDFIRLLRNENIGFTEKVCITPDQQKKYMEKYGDFYRICLFNDTPVGFVGCIDGDIRLAVKSEYRKKGVGSYMVKEIIKIYPNSHAKILIDNEASISLFESCGFKKRFLIYTYDEGNDKNTL